MTRKGNFGRKGKTIVCYCQIFRVGNQKIKEKKGSEEQNPHLLDLNWLSFRAKWYKPSCSACYAKQTIALCLKSEATQKLFHILPSVANHNTAIAVSDTLTLQVVHDVRRLMKGTIGYILVNIVNTRYKRLLLRNCQRTI